MSPAKQRRLKLRRQARAKKFHPKPVYTCGSFAELKRHAELMTPADLRRFLEGRFIWELLEKRKIELMETPEGLAQSLKELREFEILEAT